MHTIDSMGFVRGDHHQGVFQDALTFQVAEELPERIIQIPNGGLLGRVVALQVVFRGRIGLVGTNGQQPRFFLLFQLADVVLRPFEERLVILAPRELQIVAISESFQAMGGIEADVRHDLVFGHEAQAGPLEVVRGKSVLVQLGR